MRTQFALLIALAAASPTFAQTTWVVDDDPGPGVDFVEIQPAFEAASAGDIVLVRDGLYASPVVLRKGLRVVGDDGARLGAAPGSFQIVGLAAGRVAAVAGFDFEHFSVINCRGFVVLDGHVERSLEGVAPGGTSFGSLMTHIVDSDDVRIRGHDLGHVDRSTVELVQSRDMFTNGLPVLGESRLHLVSAEITGAFGSEPPCYVCLAGDGAPALRCESSEVVIAECVLRGGDGGISYYNPIYDGNAAPAVDACGGTVRTSHSTVTGGLQGGSYPIAPYWLSCGAEHFEAAPRLDPTLRMSGDPSPGSTLTLRIEGTPGDNIRLLLGRRATRRPIPGSPVDQLVLPDRLSPLGAIPPSGRIEFTVTVPHHWTAGTLLHLQAAAVEPGGRAKMTSSVPLFVR